MTLSSQFFLFHNARIQSGHNHRVLEWILLHCELLWSFQLRTQNRLNFITVDDTRNISILHLCPWQVVTRLKWCDIALLTVNLSHFPESTLGPDDEPTKVPSRRQLQQV